MATYIVPDCNLSELEVRIEKLNRRAAKLGISAITVAKTHDHVKARVNQLTVDGHINSQSWRRLDNMEKGKASDGAFLADAWTDSGERMIWWKVEVEGEKPALADWTFVAVLEPMTTDDGVTLNFVRCLPGETCPAEYRERIGACDHCKTIRRRNETFVVRHTDGSHKCVGRQCLKDFLGYHADPHQLASWAEMLATLGQLLCEYASDEDWLGDGGFGGADRCWDLKLFLATAACRIRLFGWLSRGKAYEQQRGDSTASVVIDLLTPPRPSEGAVARKEWEKLSEQHDQIAADEATAEAAIEWARGIEAGDNDYLANVNLVARVGVATRKTAGVAASILVAHAKAIEQEINRQREAAKPESHHVGEIGKRLACIKVTCEKVIMHETDFGVTGIHKLADEHGNDIVWFASTGRAIDEGETVYIAGTVKAHGEFRGRKQTTLSRVTVLDEDAAQKAIAKAQRKAKRLVKA